MRWLYLLIDLGTIFFPLLFSFHRRIRFDREWKSFFSAALPVAVVFIVWDILFTQQGVWSFNPSYTLGVDLLNLPIEEVLFFVCIPFSCVFTYHCLDRFYKLAWSPAAQDRFCIVFSVALLLVGVVSIHRLYTATTLISTALVCLGMNFYKRALIFGKAITVYAVLLVPFSIVNGLLTGSGLAAPVVRYNNGETLGVRLGTIPVEDIFYGLELVLANVFLFERFRKRREA